MKRLLLAFVAGFAGCGSSEPPVVIHEHRILMDEPEATPDELELREANRIFGQGNREYIRLSHEMRDTKRIEFLRTGIEQEYERRKASDGYLSAAQWRLDQYKGKTLDEVIAEHPPASD